jgi:preprotein translocase subunit SecB
MKPHNAPIECRAYFVTEMQFGANQTFDPKKPAELPASGLEIKSELEAPAEGQTQWGVTLSIQQTIQPDKNAPYNFALKIWGAFEPRNKFPEEKKRQVMLTNGSSILYGAAREIVREMTARGPFASLLLPTMSFYPLPSPPQPSPKQETPPQQSR